jgi:hypothetical protein
MTALHSCPEPLLLSQLCDHELGAEHERILSRHLETCAACSARLLRMEQVQGRLRTGILQSSSQSSFDVPSSECLPPSAIAAYVQKVLPSEELRKAEKHLQICNFCSTEVIEAFRISSSLRSARKIPVPSALTARVRAVWQTPAPEPRADKLSRFVLQFAQKGMQLIEQHVVEPFRDIQAALSPLPAYRAGEEQTMLSLTLKAERATILLSAVPDGKDVALTMTLYDADQQLLSGQRIFLRQNGTSIFSAKTDKEGALRIPHLSLGSYEIACSGIQTTFQVELRM